MCGFTSFYRGGSGSGIPQRTCSAEKVMGEQERPGSRTVWVVVTAFPGKIHGACVHWRGMVCTLGYF